MYNPSNAHQVKVNGLNITNIANINPLIHYNNNFITTSNPTPGVTAISRALVQSKVRKYRL